ncbi:hypothetical protein BU16DRAFT_536830 [Lophium mytilinum]|uniref:Uncharacterized protein n=1 Tax=Lophium mytilinum TaxID=390894 RepID=A0A6A6R4H9_9PEZI|nr:hypothetical protein BU16DRAFT_536830 [Lophium mytilinum]
MSLLRSSRSASLPALEVKTAPHHWVGHCHLTAKQTEVCEHIAKEKYDWAFGARVLGDAVADIKSNLCISYTGLGPDEEIFEGTNGGPLQRFEVQLRPKEEGSSEIVVLPKGQIVLPVEWK